MVQPAVNPKLSKRVKSKKTKFDVGGHDFVMPLHFFPDTMLQCGIYAGVAELADALRSGRSGGNLVWVQIPPSAPTGLQQMPLLGDSLTVEHLTLDQVVGVRVPVPQP